MYAIYVTNICILAVTLMLSLLESFILRVLCFMFHFGTVLGLAFSPCLYKAVETNSYAISIGKTLLQYLHTTMAFCFSSDLRTVIPQPLHLYLFLGGGLVSICLAMEVYQTLFYVRFL